MSEDEMTLERLMHIIAAYGGQPERWPAAERDTALALVGRSGRARAIVDDAAELDGLLDKALEPGPSAELRADVLAMAQPSRRSNPLSWLWPFGPVWQPASALVVACLLGVLVGLNLPDASQSADDPVTIDEWFAETVLLDTDSL